MFHPFILATAVGVGAAVIGSISNLFAVALSALVGWFFNDTLVPLLLGILFSAVLSLIIIWQVNKTEENVLS